MPRGIPNVKVAGQPMTSEDIALAEERIKDKRSPLHEDDFKELEQKMANRKVIVTPNGPIAQVGNFRESPIIGHASTLKKFSRIEPDYTGWIKMTNEQCLLYQDLRLLIGHDGDKKLGLIDPHKLLKIKQDAKKGLLSDVMMEALEKLEATK